MRIRKSYLVLAGCLLALLVVSWQWTAGKGTGDDRRFQQMVHAWKWHWRFRSAETRFPGSLVRRLHIADLTTRYWRKGQLQQEALLASGYLTNTTLMITNLPPGDDRSYRAEVRRRLLAGVRLEFWEFGMHSNQVGITCRSRDLPLIRAKL